MRMSLIMVVMMIMSSLPYFTFSQETPVADEQTVEQTTEHIATPETPTTEQQQPAPQEMPSEPVTTTEPNITPPVEPESAKQTSATTESDVTPPGEPTPVKETQTETAAQAPAEETKPVTAPTTEQTVVIPVEPEPVKEEEIIIPEEETETEAPAGIDTVSLENPQGNWLFKRIWWERAEERYEKIRLLVDAIWESRVKFFNERNKLDRNVLDPFYLAIGIDRGELQIILSEINDFLEKQREQQGELSEQERILHETYITEEETLKQLKIDMDTIVNLDNEIDNALGKFMEQVNRVKNYEAQAWNSFKEIAHLLNDTKARELYYTIEGAARNIKNISVYLDQQFFTHFNKLIEQAMQLVARVQSQMDALKEKGIKFQRQSEQLEQQKQQEEQDDENDDEDVAPKPALGWFDWILSGFSNAFDYIFSIIRMPYDMIFGK